MFFETIQLHTTSSSMKFKTFFVNDNSMLFYFWWLVGCNMNHGS